MVVVVLVIVAASAYILWGQKNSPECTLDARSGLTVQLRDKDGNPVLGAKISSPQYKGYSFDSVSSGTYSGLIEGNGTYTFTIEKAGFQTYTGSVNLVRSGCHVISQSQNIILQKVSK